MKKTIFLLACFLIANLSFAGLFTSFSSGNWLTPGTWTILRDADNTPDYDDTIIIQSGHSITVNGTACLARNVTVDGSLGIPTGNRLYIAKDYVLNGVEGGGGDIGFLFNSGGIISGSGTFGTSVRYSFSGNRTIAAGTNIIKSSSTGTSIAAGVTVINLGTLTIGLVSSGANATFFNGATGTLRITRAGHVTSSFLIDASTSGNTVEYNFTDGNNLIKSPIGGVFHHLRISGTTTKSLQSDITVNGNFVCVLGSGFNFRSFNMNVRGNVSMGSTTYTQQSASTLTLDGTSTQTLAFTGSVTSVITNLVINNAAGVNTTSGIIRITEALTVTAGNFNVGTNRITLASDATSTARIAESSGTFSGTMAIERFITTRSDGYSDMSSPVSNATFAGWNDDISMLFSAYTSSSTPSCWGYDEVAWDYYAISSSGTAITPGVGYDVFLDNDGDTTTTFSATTLDLSGTPNIGDIAVPVTINNDGWNLVGNPYASFIDWSTFRTNSGISMNSQFQFYDESIGDFGIGNLGDVIAQSQGFWIECTSAGNATFHENNKTTDNSSSFRKPENPLFGLRVSSPNMKYTSNTYFRFNEEATLAFENDHDLSFIKVPRSNAPSLFTHSSDGKKLRINELKSEENMSIPMSFKPGTKGVYIISAQHLESLFQVGYNQLILEDKLLGIFYNLSEGNYEFTSNLGEKEERFVIHFKSASTLPNLTSNEITFTNSAEGVFVNFNLDEQSKAIISVYNVAGQEIINAQNVYTTSNRVRLDLPLNYQGIYIIRVIIDEKVITQRFYKN